MTHGRELPVCQNGTHEAWPYMFPNGHSVTSEWNYASPISSVWSAWRLRGEVLRDDFEHGLLRDCNFSVAHRFSSDSISSILTSSQGPHCKRRMGCRVCFDDRIELALGLECEYTMHHLSIEHTVLQEWSDKPWRYTPNPPSRKFSWRRLSNFVYPFCDFSVHCEAGAKSVLKGIPPGESSCHGRGPLLDAQISLQNQGDALWVNDLLSIVDSLSSSTDSVSNDDSFSVRMWLVSHENQTACFQPRVAWLNSDSTAWHEQVFAIWRQELHNAVHPQVHVVPLQLHDRCNGASVADLIVTNMSHVPVAIIDFCLDVDAGTHSFSVAAVVENASVKSLLHQIWDASALHRFGDSKSIVFEASDSKISVTHGSRIWIDVKKHAGVKIKSNSFKHCKPLRDITNQQNFRDSDDSDTVGGDPLSVMAVLSSPFSDSFAAYSFSIKVDLFGCISNLDDIRLEIPDDEMSVMQIDRSVGIQCKNAPADLQHGDLLHAFHGQQFQDDIASGSDVPVEQSSEGYSPGDSSVLAQERPPSSDEGRQDVMLFHLEDYPIRTLVNWNSYEEMITEIAHHYGLSRDEVQDVYEVVVPPPDIGIEVVPTIVHVIGDIPHENTDRLVLVDIEYHAHRIERNFRSGPNVLRSVKSLPLTASRNEVLYRANVDRYCRSEDGRCIVFINSRRWPDYDVDKKAIAHGDYIRIAVPPSDRFACPTAVISDMIQQCFSDQQIVDAMYSDEAASGYSPIVY